MGDEQLEIRQMSEANVEFERTLGDESDGGGHGGSGVAGK
jgi:hypothetical protein